MSFGAAVEACLAGLWGVFAWPQLGFLAVGVLVGSVVGILPGLGGSATLAMLLPVTLTLDPVPACALLVGIAAVTTTTGDLTSILVGIPGEPISAATVIDGHPMAVRGEASRAIGASLLSSLVGSVAGALALGVAIPVVLPIVRSLGSPEFFMLVMLAVTFVAPLSGGSRLKGLALGGLGLLLATVGLDPISSVPRFTFGRMELWDGVGVIPVALGLFAVPEIAALEAALPSRRIASARGGRLIDGMREASTHWRLVLQSSAIGTGVGLLPGVGASLSQWLAYGHAARRSRRAHEFGRGAIEGVIAPSAANNATLGGSLVPALALGIPGGLMSAMLVTALTMKGIVPGPAMIAPEAEGGHVTLVFALVWLLVAANVLAVVLAGLSAGWLVKITTIPAWRMVPILLALTFVGAYAERQAGADMAALAVFGMLGLALAHFEWPRAPLLMGLVLGPLAENRLFLSVQAHGMSWLHRPGVVVLAVAIVLSLLGAGRGRRAAPAHGAQGACGRRGERGFALLLAVPAVSAFATAASLPLAVRLVPQLASAIVVVCLGVAWARGRFRTPTRGESPGFARRSGVGWLLTFFALIWAAGFTAGVTLAVFLHLRVAGRRGVVEALSLSGAVGGVLYLALTNVAGMTLPPGAIGAWLTGGS